MVGEVDLVLIHHLCSGLLASGADDMTVRIWNAETLQPVAELVGHSRSIAALAFSATGYVKGWTG